MADSQATDNTSISDNTRNADNYSFSAADLYVPGESIDWKKLTNSSQPSCLPTLSIDDCQSKAPANQHDEQNRPTDDDGSPDSQSTRHTEEAVADTTNGATTADSSGPDSEVANPALDASGASPDSGCTSEVECIRQNLQNLGIDPDRVTIPIVVRELAQAEDHAELVTCAIVDPEIGLIRNGPVTTVRDTIENEPRIEDYTEQPGGIERFFADTTAAILDSLTNTLRRQFLESDNPPRVMNVSNGWSVTDAAVEVLNELWRDPERLAKFVYGLLGEERGNQWLAERRNLPPANEAVDGSGGRHLTSPAENPRSQQCLDRRPSPGESPESLTQEPIHLSELDRQLFQLILDRLHDTFVNDSTVNDALDRYRRTAQQVAEGGGIIVVSAGNAGTDAESFGAASNPGSALNFFAMSDHVISVGASDINSTPGNYDDDRLADFSSRGHARYHPTVLAQGYQFPSRQSPTGSLDGTSFSSPLVAGAIALMLEQNPELSFAQVQDILRENARRLRNAAGEDLPNTAQGAGTLQIVQAIIAARNSRRT